MDALYFKLNGLTTKHQLKIHLNQKQLIQTINIINIKSFIGFLTLPDIQPTANTDRPQET